MRRYLIAVSLLNLVWEVLQLPLYSLWHETGPATIIFSVLHCTLGDVVIASLALFGSVLILGNSSWPSERYTRVGVAAVLIGVAYTGFSEWLNVFVRKSWAYSGAMPLIPVVGIGISPLLQWVMIPSAVLARLRTV